MEDYLKNSQGVTLIIVIFVMMVMAMLGAVIASLQATYFETSRTHLRINQAGFIGDAGLERGKELLNDSFGSWRPPSPPGYLREYMTVGAAKGHYDLYVTDLGGGSVKLSAFAQMDTE